MHASHLCDACAEYGIQVRTGEIFDWRGINQNRRAGGGRPEWQPLFGLRGIRKLELLRRGLSRAAFQGTFVERGPWGDSYDHLIGPGQSLLITNVQLASVAKRHPADMNYADLTTGDPLNEQSPVRQVSSVSGCAHTILHTGLDFPGHDLWLPPADWRAATAGDCAAACAGKATFFMWGGAGGPYDAKCWCKAQLVSGTGGGSFALFTAGSIDCGEGLADGVE